MMPSHTGLYKTIEMSNPSPHRTVQEFGSVVIENGCQDLGLDTNNCGAKDMMGLGYLRGELVFLDA